MDGIFTNIYAKNHSNAGKYAIHGAYGLHITFEILKVSQSSELKGRKTPFVHPE